MPLQETAIQDQAATEVGAVGFYDPRWIKRTEDQHSFVSVLPVNINEDLFEQSFYYDCLWKAIQIIQ